ncbi:MAG TPA: hypothetical protein PK993_04010 [Clostridia bacterium]|nr:hypothetical protein [Clostridia bacterium]
MEHDLFIELYNINQKIDFIAQKTLELEIKLQKLIQKEEKEKTKNENKYIKPINNNNNDNKKINKYNEIENESD